MEDSFQARVDKVFGSLAASSSTTLSALWSLTDQGIEKREWNRDKDTEDASPDHTFSDGFFAQQSRGRIRTSKLADFGELEDDGEPDDSDECNDISNENKKGKKHKPDSADDEDFNIRSSIGLDCTLDYEEEEDEYDKVAIGREKAGDRMYMRDIVDYGIDFNSHHELPSSFKDVFRDPRANHRAAKLRLKEDAATAGDFDSLKLSDLVSPPAQNAQEGQLDNGLLPKPILKKRKIHQDGKSPKRVRFHEEFVGTKYPGEQSNSAEGKGTTSQEEADVLPLGEAKTTEVFTLPQNSASTDDTASLGRASTSFTVPDYVRNPSRYTRYTLDSSDDMDEESNRRACMDFLNLVKKPNVAEHCESSASSPKSLIFTPRKKASDTLLARKDNECKQNLAAISKDKVSPVSVAAGDGEDCGSEICPMEEDMDIPHIVVDKSCRPQKPGRQYRARTNVNCDDHVTT